MTKSHRRAIITGLFFVAALDYVKIFYLAFAKLFNFSFQREKKRERKNEPCAHFSFFFF